MFFTTRTTKPNSRRVGTAIRILIFLLAVIIISALCISFIASVNRPAEPGTRLSQQPIAAPGYRPLQFTTPKPDSYQLPALGVAANGHVIDSSGDRLSLHDLFTNKIVVLSFIYTTCRDVNGCPLATSVLHQLQSKLSERPELISQTRIVTMSFDYPGDTWKSMHQYGKQFQSGGLDWRFLAPASESELHDILQAYNQPVQKNLDAAGDFTGSYSHLLRVFLIDRQRMIRNIYSVSFLHADLLLNDIQNVLLSENKPMQEADDIKHAATSRQKKTQLSGSGDNKNGYDSSSYRTKSKALINRRGNAANLIDLILNPPLGLPRLNWPANDPPTKEKIELGRRLFYDRRLSLNNTFSCAMCHIPEQGFTSNELNTAVGIEGRSVRRNSPTLYNVGYATRLFHDARESTLSQQVWGPLLAKNEMGNPSVGYVIDKIQGIDEYPALFEKAFGKGPSMETVGMALANYERTLNSAGSPFDHWKYSKLPGALTHAEQNGYRLFVGKAGCAECHTVGENFALFSDFQLHNTGLGYSDSIGTTEESGPIQLAPGIFVQVDASTIDTVSDPKPNDLGLYEITQNPNDRWRYKTPNLRNVALTAPYMHNGTFSTLEEVVEFYDQGGVRNDNLDPLIHPLNLTAEEKQQLVAFLGALTGDNVDLLISDAFAAPIGDSD